MKALLRALKYASITFINVFIATLKRKSVITLTFWDGEYPKEDVVLLEAMDCMKMLLYVYAKSGKEAQKIRLSIIEGKINVILKEEIK